MNYQQILAIPFYFNAIISAFMEIQKTSSGVSRKVNQELVPKDIYLYTISTGPKFYVITPDKKSYTLIQEGMYEEMRRGHQSVYYLCKFLETAKLFEATGGNPLGIYMKYKTNIKTQINGDGYENGIYPSLNGEDIDYIFYQTLCLMKLTQGK